MIKSTKQIHNTKGLAEVRGLPAHSRRNSPEILQDAAIRFEEFLLDLILAITFLRVVSFLDNTELIMLAAAAPVSAQANDLVKGLHMLVVLAMETVVSDVFVVRDNRLPDFVGDVAIWLGPRTKHAPNFFEVVLCSQLLFCLFDF